MARLIIGCGRTHTIHYNPLYTDPQTGTQMGNVLRWSSNIFYQRTHNHAPRGPQGDFLMDTNPLMHPDWLGSIIDPDDAFLTHPRAQNKFAAVVFENIPADVFNTDVRCATAFRHAYNMLQNGGQLSLRTGAPMGPNSAIRNALNKQLFHTIAIDHNGTLTALK